MCEQTLRSYFEKPEQQRRALDAFFVAWGGTWCVHKELLDSYDASKDAFDQRLSADEAFEHFHKIYQELKGPNWQVFRPNGPGKCWGPKTIFETIKGEFPSFSWDTVSLLEFPITGTRLYRELKSRLATMEDIKPKNGYPHMTVSKFLHFYNPGLFPIYDNAIIGDKVFRRFQNDFRAFCESEKIEYKAAKKDDTEKFLLYYMGWASSLLAVRHKDFMQVFVKWLEEQPAAGLEKRRFKAETLYATAFEFTVIGATEASSV